MVNVDAVNGRHAIRFLNNSSDQAWTTTVGRSL